MASGQQGRPEWMLTDEELRTYVKVRDYLREQHERACLGDAEGSALGRLKERLGPFEWWGERRKEVSDG